MRHSMLHSFLIYPRLLLTLCLVAVVSLLALSPSTAIAQLTVQYQKNYEDTSLANIGSCAIDSLGSVYVIGHEYPFIQLTKLNASGDIEWQRSISGSYPVHGNDRYNRDVEVDASGDVIAAGTCAEQSNTAAEVVVAKYDSDGNLLWGSPVSIDLNTPYYGNRLDLAIDESGFIYVAAQQSTFSDPDLPTLSHLVVAGIDSNGTVAFRDERPAESFSGHGWPLRRVFTSDSTARVVCRTLVDSLTCYRPEPYDDSVFVIENQTSIHKYSHFGYEERVFGPWKAHSGSLDHSCNDRTSLSTMPRDVSERPDGSLVIACQVYEGDMDYVILSVAENGTLNWSTPSEDVSYANAGPNGESYFTGFVFGSPWKIYKYDQSGNFVWESPQPGSYGSSLVVDRNDNICVFDGQKIVQLNALDGTIDWSFDVGLGSGYLFLGVDNSNRLHALTAFSNTSAGYYGHQKRFEIVDATADHSPIAEHDFELYEADLGQPGFLTNHAGTFSTDQEGAFEFDVSDLGELTLNGTGTGLNIGDLAVVATKVRSRDAARHPLVLATKYTAWLDPIKFDENGIPDLSQITSDATQELVQDHTEYRYNILVSVEWDAEESYLQGLQSEFRYMSNYLYDVTDGQLRLDTVMIYDDAFFWHQADMRIYASNMVHPSAGVSGHYRLERSPIAMPRKWFGGSEQRYRTFSYHPLNLVISNNYRTMAHEFGHYFLGFYDEYRFVNPSTRVPLPESARCNPRPAGNYGFMDYQYNDNTGGVRASELSSYYRYTSENCQKTEQYVFNGSKSCWDYWELSAERIVDGVYLPVFKPSTTGSTDGERQTPAGLDYIPGPNDTEGTPDYDVGALVQFPVPITAPPNEVQSLRVFVQGATHGGVNVKLRKRDASLNPLREIDQGNTTDLGFIYVLGVNILYDHVYASGRSWNVAPTLNQAGSIRSTERSWRVGDVDLSQGKSLFGNGASYSPSADSVELSLYEVDGYFPMISSATFEGGSVKYSLQTSGSAFPTVPEVELIPTAGDIGTFSSSAVAGGYETTISDTLGNHGIIRVLAEDNSAHGFFFTSKYSLSNTGDSSDLTGLPGPDGDLLITLDTLNTSVDSVLMISSPYLVPLDGLSSDVVQAGQTHSIEVAPSVTLSGINSIRISYDESALLVGDGLTGDESTLQIYSWNDQLLQWDMVGGYVDTAFNYVVSTITETGTYAAFTTDFVTDVEDEYGDVLPYRFDLSQNYPNPFNPVTTIEYSLPRRSSVRIDIFNLLGQKVQTLVNYEQSAGSYAITWDGTNTAGKSVSTGVYFYRFQVGDHVETKKMLLLK